MAQLQCENKSTKGLCMVMLYNSEKWPSTKPPQKIENSGFILKNQHLKNWEITTVL